MDKRIEYIKESLMGCIESQMKHLEEVDAEELGEVVDMLKDLAELEYYCSVTKAMEEYEPNQYRDMDRGQGRMYYSGDKRWKYDSSSPNSSAGNINDYWPGEENRMMENNYEYQSMRDPKEGRSPHSRKMYMEHKNLNSGDRTAQMRELEIYMQELTQDMVEMIEGASPEEKQYLNKKITALASKIV